MALDYHIRQLILSRGDQQLERTLLEDEVLFSKRSGSIAFSFALAEQLKKSGLGRVGLAVTFYKKTPVWAFVSVGFVPASDREFALAENDGLLVGVEGVSEFAAWPMVEQGEESTYKTYWCSADAAGSGLKKLLRLTDEDELKMAKAAAAEYLKNYQKIVESHWIPFMR